MNHTSYATILEIDSVARTALIEMPDGKEARVSVPQGTNIEVAEQETVGECGGDMEDLEVGFQVSVEITENPATKELLATNIVSHS